MIIVTPLRIIKSFLFVDIFILKCLFARLYFIITTSFFYIRILFVRNNEAQIFENNILRIMQSSNVKIVMKMAQKS